MVVAGFSLRELTQPEGSDYRKQEEEAEEKWGN